jgi:hypothetical protein
MGKRGYGYSYEIYTPEGRRVDYEDHFIKRISAVAAMMAKMEQDDVPVDSTALVCRRYDDGETTDITAYIKRVSIARREERVMRYTEDDVVNHLVAWIRNEADVDDLAAMYSEFKQDEVVVVVAGPAGPCSSEYMNGNPYHQEDE